MFIGVDVGGTFTDLIAVDPASGRWRVAKVPTTNDDQSRGFLAGLQALGTPLGKVSALVHGTTAGTNAVLERKGARCGLITTTGFRDSLELARRTRPRLYGLTGSFVPIIARDFRIEVPERLDAEGNVVIPLDEAAVERAARDLLARGAEAIVIHFLHCFRNPMHEKRAAEIVRAFWPNAYVSVGHEILAELREFERGTTAALNAYIQPVVGRYVQRLSQGLAEGGFRQELLIMQGNGGIMAASLTPRHAVHTLLSGPAAGAIAAAATGVAAGLPDLISCDMGGTSFDVCLIRQGTPTISAERDIDYAVPVGVPMIDIHTIGAGGGSIARISRAGTLTVGPESAGAYPGSICYGRGGSEPTVTDANLLLGRINPAAINGVDGTVASDSVAAALAERIGRPLGLDAVGAAAAILAVANDQMATAIRLASIDRGCDPRDFALFAYGGAGPLHAVALARELGIPRVLVPRFPGITSALGCVIADLRHDFVQHVSRRLEDAAGPEMDAILAAQVAAGRALLDAERAPVDAVEVLHEADLQYEGQTHLFRIAVTAPFDPARVAADFAEQYRQRFSIVLKGLRPRLVNLRTAVFGRRAAFPLSRLAGEAGAAPPPPASRRAWFAGTWHDTAVLRREHLKPGDSIAGPAIIEQLDTTTVIEPGARAEVDRLGNLIITV